MSSPETRYQHGTVQLEALPGFSTLQVPISTKTTSDTATATGHNNRICIIPSTHRTPPTSPTPTAPSTPTSSSAAGGAGGPRGDPPNRAGPYVASLYVGPGAVTTVQCQGMCLAAGHVRDALTTAPTRRAVSAAGRGGGGSSSGSGDDADSISTLDEEIYSQTSSNASSTGRLMNDSLSVTLPVSAAATAPGAPPAGGKKKQQSACSLSPTPSFTLVDISGYQRGRAKPRRSAYCASQSVLKIMLTFSVSFLLAMLATIIYVEVYLWKHWS